MMCSSRTTGYGSATAVSTQAIGCCDFQTFSVRLLVITGMYSAAGAHGDCPAEYQGKAYVDDQIWDISGLSTCHSGSTCAVSTSYTSPTFSVPTGCAAVHSQVVKNSGRGYVSSPVDPTVGNGFRGEIEIIDDPPSSGVYDLTVAVSLTLSLTFAPFPLPFPSFR